MGIGGSNSRISSSGALGIGQLEPSTVSFVCNHLLRVRLDPNQADDNIRMTAAYLAYLVRHSGGSETKAVSAYYQGFASLRRLGAYHETRHYTRGVLAYSSLFGPG